MPFIIIFVIVPFIELATFASVSEYIGIWTTLMLAFLTAIIGGLLVKYQGLHTILSMRQAMERGQMPLTEIFDGFCLVAAGALLITPGFVTDTIGFALLIPPVRGLLRYYIRKHTSWAVLAQTEGFDARTRSGDPDIIEGDYERMDDASPTKRDEIGRE
ncbi:MAG: FxsA family protein [Rhodospirillales bacterium]|nr:FxsA family protein [Rhodospirillales bacterium]